MIQLSTDPSLSWSALIMDEMKEEDRTSFWSKISFPKEMSFCDTNFPLNGFPFPARMSTSPPEWVSFRVL